MSVTLTDGLGELIARASRRNPARITTLLCEAHGLEAINGAPSPREIFVDHLVRSERDADGIDQADLALLVVMRDDMRGRPAGEQRLAVSCGLDRDDVRRLAELRRDKLVATGGTAGHRITPLGRQRLTTATI
jgi:Holliday junction resolvasome RuvABC ATP-dependent DNA helicase subunit